MSRSRRTGKIRVCFSSPQHQSHPLRWPGKGVRARNLYLRLHTLLQLCDEPFLADTAFVVPELHRTAEGSSAILLVLTPCRRARVSRPSLSDEAPWKAAPIWLLRQPNSHHPP